MNNIRQFFQRYSRHARQRHVPLQTQQEENQVQNQAVPVAQELSDLRLNAFWMFRVRQIQLVEDRLRFGFIQQANYDIIALNTRITLQLHNQ